MIISKPYTRSLKTALMLASVATAALLASVPPLHAQSSMSNENPARYSASARVPLILIRFNQRHVYFERSLNQVVQKARAVKPDVVFDILTVPKVGSDGQRNTNKVIQALVNAGIAKPNIRVASTPPSRNGYDEVHVFVE